METVNTIINLSKEVKDKVVRRLAIEKLLQKELQKQLELEFKIPLTISLKDIIIMQLVADGFTALQISDKIGVNERTIEHRILRLRKELNCKSITHLAITLLRANLIQ